MGSLHDEVFAICPDVRTSRSVMVSRWTRDPGRVCGTPRVMRATRYEELLVDLPCWCWQHSAETSTAEGCGT
jgi:hypothetical protein